MKRIAASVLPCVLIASGGLLLRDYLDPPETFVIRPSYAFDVTNPELLAGAVEYVAVVEVLGEGTAVGSDGDVYTDFDVHVVRALKGSLTDPVVVRQTGGRIGEDTYVLEDQQLLMAGRSYVLVLGREPDRSQLTVTAGPISAKPLTGDAAKDGAVIAAWRKAIANQRKPT